MNSSKRRHENWTVTEAGPERAIVDSLIGTLLLANEGQLAFRSGGLVGQMVTRWLFDLRMPWDSQPRLQFLSITPAQPSLVPLASRTSYSPESLSSRRFTFPSLTIAER